MNKPDIVIDQYISDEFGLLGKQIKQFLELFTIQNIFHILQLL